MKLCSKCQEEKPLESFAKKSTTRDGLQTYCRECNKARSRQYYHENKEAHRALMRARNAAAVLRNQRFLGEYLSLNPCVDCGESDIRVLDFDHVGENKLHNVSELVRQTYSISSLQREIEKCEVRCANCHRRVTNERADMWRQKYITNRL